MKKKLTALQEFFYDGKTRRVGEVFEAVDPDANILVVIGKAQNASAKAAPQKLRTADLKAEEPPIQDSEPPRRRRYLRRDMTATE